MARIRRIMIVACLVAVVLHIAKTNAQDVGAARVVQLPTDRVLGHYTILPEGRPRRPTFREAQEDLRAGREDPKLAGGELRGRFAYPRGTGLWISLGDDQPGTIAEKLEVIKSIDPRHVHALAISSQVDLECLRLISRFENLRDLVLVVGEHLESNEGCKCLEKLSNLTFVSLSHPQSCLYGSKRFCEAVLSLKRLKHLSIPCEKLTDAHVAILATHPTLESLWLRSQHPVLGSKSLQALQKMPRLRELMIVCTDTVADKDVMAFTEVRSLELLSLFTSAPLTCQDRFKERRPDCWFLLQPPSSECR